jgi:hypothetical protein
MLYLLEHAKARWQVWLLYSPSYLICAVVAVIVGVTAFHEFETGATTAGAFGVALTAMLAAVSFYALRGIVRRAAAMFPRPGDVAPPPATLHPPSSARVDGRQTYIFGALAASLFAGAAMQVPIGHFGVAIVCGAGALDLAARAVATRAPARPATSNRGAVRAVAVLDSVFFGAVILAIVFLATGNPIWLVAFIAISAGAHALRVWMLRGQPTRKVNARGSQ